MNTAAAIHERKSVRQDLISRIDVLTREVQTLEEKLRGEQGKLALLIGQRPALARAIVVDEEKSSKGRELAISIAEVEMRVEGLTTLVAEKRAELTSVEVELRRIDAEESHRIRLGRLEELKAAGTDLAKSINEQHAAVQTQIAALDQICVSLGREFVNTDGRLHASPVDDLSLAASAVVAQLNEHVARVRPARR